MGPEDFDRPLHMILGLPFDAVSMRDVVAKLRTVAVSRKRCFISTPNLNFLIAARADQAFRQSVFDSDRLARPAAAHSTARARTRIGPDRDFARGAGSRR